LRLRLGIMLGIVPFILVLSAIPAGWFNIHTVGPDFRTVGPDGPGPDDERRQLDGVWTLNQFRSYNATWQGQDADPSGKWRTQPIQSEGGPDTAVNGHAAEVYAETVLLLVAGIWALSLGALGMWNIARHDRWRWFTAASFFLAAVLFLGGCYHYAMSLPDAMWSDTSVGGGESFGAMFDPYIDPEGGEPGYYFEFDGGYPNDDPSLGEQLQYGPGAGWWLAGAAGIFALIASAVLVAAPSLQEEVDGEGHVQEVVRYVPVPTVGDLKRRRRYPKRMPAVSRNSPGQRRRPRG
jgi:hypothetical protein